MQPTANPSQMLPPSLMRGGQTSPGQIFQQNPLATGMSPDAMASQPGLMPPPPAGSQAINQGMPAPMPGQAPQAGQPQTALPGQQPQVSESEMILQALMKRLESHSKLTHKTADTLISMIQASIPTPGADPTQSGTPS